MVKAADINFGGGSKPEAFGDRRRFEQLPGGGYAYRLIDEPLAIEFRYVRLDHHEWRAEVDVKCAWPGAKHHDATLAYGGLNLSSQSARKTLAKHCQERAHTKAEDFDWISVIDVACLRVITAVRMGDEAVSLDDAPEAETRDYNVLGLSVPADAPSFLIAPGDSLKSLVTLFVLGTLARRGIRVLYVDWEWTADRHKRRKIRLFGPERLPELRYIKCRSPLTTEVDRLRRYCDDEQIQFLAIDSVGMACDGKLVDDDTARRFHQALACLPPALCAAHVAKSGLDNGDQTATPHAFGSVYFENLCRMAWAVKKQVDQHGDPNIATVGLFRTKQNDGARVADVGWRFAFTPERITVQSADLAGVKAFAGRLPYWQRIAEVLKQGPMTLIALANELGDGVTVDTIDVTVRRKKELFGRVTSTDGISRIALVERRHEHPNG